MISSGAIHQAEYQDMRSREVAFIKLRLLGSSTGMRIRRPDTWAQLQSVASSKLLGGAAMGDIFDEAGDKVDDDIDLMHADQAFYVAPAEEAWRSPGPWPRSGLAGTLVALLPWLLPPRS